MDYDQDKVDEMVLALLYLTRFRDNYVTRAWKEMDWAALGRLYEKGYIDNPRGKVRSVILTEAGEQLSEALFFKHFGGKE
jgi:hypothetical protein